VPSNARALALLDRSTTDFDIHNRDYPHSGFRWEVRAIYFFDRADGFGHTLWDAVTDALSKLTEVKASTYGKVEFDTPKKGKKCRPKTPSRYSRRS
jgi:hypothetical protein